MDISVVLRLVDHSIARGELVGEAEVITTGERRLIRGADELVAFLRTVSGPLGESARRDNDESA